VVGSPDYLAGRATCAVTPASDIDPSSAIYNWQFEKDDEPVDVEVDRPVTLDDQELMVEAALEGCGLAYVWENRVLRHTRAARSSGAWTIGALRMTDYTSTIRAGGISRPGYAPSSIA
jgi:hypothetical protein